MGKACSSLSSNFNVGGQMVLAADSMGIRSEFSAFAGASSSVHDFHSCFLSALSYCVTICPAVGTVCGGQLMCGR
jgi:hypothetical protein